MPISFYTLKKIHKFASSEAAYLVTESKRGPMKEKDYRIKKNAERSYGSSNLIILRKDVLDNYSLWGKITHFENKSLFEVKTRASVSSPYTQTKKLHIRSTVVSR